MVLVKWCNAKEGGVDDCFDSACVSEEVGFKLQDVAAKQRVRHFAHDAIFAKVVVLVDITCRCHGWSGESGGLNCVALDEKFAVTIADGAGDVARHDGVDHKP